jgi:ubiquinone/menaquinone biosynthesis C-methylase UbiE
MACEHPDRIEWRVYSQATLYECRSCGLVFLTGDVLNHQAEVLYEDYYKNETGGRFNYGLEYVIRMFRFFRALKIFSIYPRAKTILDIGSGRGFMLYYLKKFYGYRTAMGTQISKNALEFSRKKLGLEIYDKDFFDLVLGDVRFDVISMWHVLEHVPAPEHYIEKIYRTLTPGGNLVIEVPNLCSWTAAFTGSYWLGLDLKYHLYFFTPESLGRLLKKYGFRIKIIHTFSLEYSIFISTQSIVSFLTRSDHLFFEWLQTGRMRPIVLGHLVLFVLLLPVCFLVNLLFFFSKKGEVLLIVAEKPAE